MINPVKQLVIALIMCGFACCSQPESSKPSAAGGISYLVFRLSSGWGYSIYKDGKLFIRQETIPAIPKNTPFATEGDAEAIARSVIQKLKLGESPRVSITELQQLGIKY
ncbi:MAG TPA: DUF4907 domain-containing protein [Chitinophagaceae bacterium]|nr:DUF4907 domain-containing protein [Chitinophagaceae bacterium]